MEGVYSDVGLAWKIEQSICLINWSKQTEAKTVLEKFVFTQKLKQTCNS